MAVPSVIMLPEEIVDHIFSLCLDIPSLKTSTRAHPILSRIAERYLYTDIILHNHTKYDPCYAQLLLDVGQLSNLISTRPGLINYVYSLTITPSSNSKDDLLPFLDALPSILALLLNLRKMEFSCDAGFRWNLNFPESLCLSLGNCFGLPSMKHVKFRGINIPLSLLHQLGNAVKILMFNCCIFSGTYTELESSPDCHPLEELSMVDLHYRSLKTLVPWVANGCKQLSRLTFSPFDRHEGGPFVLIKPVLVSCSSTLINLDLDVASLYNYDYDRESWMLPSLPQLQALVFHGKTSYLKSHTTCFDVLAWLLGPMPHLKRLTLHLHFMIKSLNMNWSQLDALLAASRPSAEFIVLLISTTYGRMEKYSWDMKPYLMQHRNIRQMVKENVLDIQTIQDGCYCCAGSFQKKTLTV